MQPDSSVGTVWDSVRQENALQDMFSLQLCPPRESTLFPGTFVKQDSYMVSLQSTGQTTFSCGTIGTFRNVVR